jgi:Rieske Fe-S protein
VLDPNPSRRTILVSAVAALNVITAGLLATPCLGYLLSPLLRGRAIRWVSLGPASQFLEDVLEVVRYRYRDESDFVARDVRRTAFVRRAGDDLIVLSATCTHLGCNVAFNAQTGTFDCPCHGGRYDRSGTVVAGPPPKPLARFQTRLVSGDLEIQVT